MLACPFRCKHIGNTRHEAGGKAHSHRDQDHSREDASCTWNDEMVQFAPAAGQWGHKVSGKKLAMELRRGVRCLRYDPEYVASKKVKPEDKDKEQEVLDKAAKEIYKKHKIQETIFKPEHMEMEDKEETGICLLDGCGLLTENGKRYCTKRHYHAAQHKNSKPKKTAFASWMVLSATGIPGAEAMQFTVKGIVIPYIQAIVFVIGFVVVIIMVFLHGGHQLRTTPSSSTSL